MDAFLDPNDRFRQRRQQARKRRRFRRTIGGIAILLALAAVAAGAGTLPRGGDDPGKEAVPKAVAKKVSPRRTGPPVPKEIRGVHVAMALASIPGKIEEFAALEGLNTIELDVKDENGEIAFHTRAPTLAKQVGSAMRYYDPVEAARKIHSRGIYLIGRVVCFEDPILSEKRPDLAIQSTSGGVWRNHAGLGWTNPYDKRVWDYNLSIAKVAARAGFDEIMFDYVRFPSDGPIESAVWPGRVNERMGETIARFLAYARQRLEPLGTRLSAAVFGLSATRDLGIGQRPRLLAPYLDAIYPMVYPSHYGAGEYNIADPNGNPGATVTMSLRYFRKALRGMPTRLVPWLQDFTLGRT